MNNQVVRGDVVGLCRCERHRHGEQIVADVTAQEPGTQPGDEAGLGQ